MGQVTVAVTVGPGQGRFLAECRSSIAQQGYRHIDVLEIAWDDDGLPAARERAVWEARGKFVRIIEASDTLPPDAIARQAHALRAHRSGMAAGWTVGSHATWRDRAFLPRDGEDFSLGNRMIRTSAWRAARLHFDPRSGAWADADMIRADRAIGTTAVRADVLVDQGRRLGLPFGHAVRWRTQVTSWCEAMSRARNALEGRVELAGWANAVLDQQMGSVVTDVAGYDTQDWQQFVALSAALLDSALERTNGARAERLVETWLAAAGRREDLVELVEARHRDSQDFPTKVVEDDVLADPSFFGVGSVPESVTRMGASETPLWASVRRQKWTGDALELELVALIRGVDSVGDDSSVEVTLVRCHEGQVHPLPVQVRLNPEATRIAGDRYHDHDQSWVHVEVPAELLGGLRGRWYFEVAVRIGGIVRRGLVTDRDHRAGPGQDLGMHVAGRSVRTFWSGHLGLAVGRRRRPASGPELTGVRQRPDDSALELTGTGATSGTIELSWGPIRLATSVVTSGAGFVATIPWEVDQGFGSRGPAPIGDYAVRLDGRPLRLAPHVLGDTPTDHVGPTYRTRLRALPEGGALVELSPPRGDAEIGPSAQRKLQQWYAGEHRVAPDLVYYQSFTGEHANDNPRAIFEAQRRLRPDLRVRWCAADATVQVPSGAERVLVRSAAWYETLATARWIVTNIELEDWFWRREGQQVLQTFHGNPSKLMGRALWAQSGHTPHRIDRAIANRRHNWTAMLAPTAEMARHYREQFGFDGGVLATGHPRDDVLVSSSADLIRESTRERLGIRPDQTAVLFGPTWRDSLATNYRAARMHDALDLHSAARALGDGFVVLLRGHRFHREVDTRGAAVWDVSGWPDVNELILAADVGLFDYSSLRFDFGLTAKPMLFFVPDLEEYTRTRGFLFPYQGSAPGPMLRSTREVVDALQDLGRVRHAFAAERAAFIARFHAEQDAHSAERVAARFFDSGTTSLGDL